MLWLIHKDVLQQLRDVRRGTQITAAEQEAHEERFAAREGGGPRSLHLAGDVAEIRVEGVLTKKPDFWAWLLGLPNTTYRDLLAAIAVAKTDASVKRVQVYVDSPGGSADGLFETLDALADLRASKPVSVVASSAFSAGYGIAAAAGPIEALHAASMFGSVGVATSYAFWEAVEQIDLTNTDSPDKRPDVRTEEGRAVVVRELDAIFDLFANAIAKGRSASTGDSVTRDDVAKGFGRGASFVASEAKKRGMIDTIAKPTLRAVSTKVAEATEQQTTAAAEGGRRKAKQMTLEELRAQHPELYNAAVQAGVMQERDRVDAHLTMGEASGDRETASKAIRSGDAMTQALQAKYLAAGMNRADRKTRQSESDAAGVVADGAKPTAEPGEEFAASVVTVLERRLGKAAKQG
jgi:ClpP class serine protease